jgi:hypothetical protein
MSTLFLFKKDLKRRLPVGGIGLSVDEGIKSRRSREYFDERGCRYCSGRHDKVIFKF